MEWGQHNIANTYQPGPPTTVENATALTIQPFIL